MHFTRVEGYAMLSTVTPTMTCIRLVTKMTSFMYCQRSMEATVEEVPLGVGSMLDDTKQLPIFVTVYIQE